MVVRLVGVLLLCGLTTPAWALTEYYLDPDYVGTHTGTQSQPFNTLDASAWTTINTALVSDSVTLYCSARNAGSDTNQVWGVNVDITQKTANPTGTLTFNGRSQYNTNDTTPSWLTYSGTSKCQVTGFIAQNTAHTKYNKVTIDGFVVAQSGGEKGISICGDTWLIQNSDISHTAAASNGPLILITPTADALHEGSSAWCPAISDIIIQDNTIHDSYAELIYVGGAGCQIGTPAADQKNLLDSACNGKPAHSNITIQRNTLSNCGSRASQGDCIDIKAAITNLTISRNDITGNRADNNSRCLVTQGIQTDGTNQNYVIERNKFHDCLVVDEAAIAIVDSWGTPNGIEIRNNILTTVTSGDGIRVYDTQATGVKLYNNTIYNVDGLGINVSAGTVIVENNALLSNNSGGAQTSMSGTITSDHNAFGGTWPGTCTNCVSGLTAAAFTNAAGGDFTLPAASVLIAQALTIDSFANDYSGTTRTSPWDIGAFASGGVPSPAPSRAAHGPRLHKIRHAFSVVLVVGVAGYGTVAGLVSLMLYACTVHRRHLLLHRGHAIEVGT